jgi:uncharacterized protein YdaU (DUF1376 family)
MTAKPWMPLYIADYLADTGHLGAAQSGAYLHLIMHYWQNGSLPDDDLALARIARMTPLEWKKNRAIIAAFFESGWVHKRIDRELAHAADVSRKRRAAAGEKHSKSSANAQQKETHARGLSQPQSQEEGGVAPQSSTPPREAEPSQRPADLDGLEDRLRQAASLENDPSPSLFDLSPMLTLLGKGYDLDRDILPVLKAAAASGKRGRTWRYYVGAIEDAKASNDAIRPASNGNGTGPPKPAFDWDLAVATYERLGGQFLEGNGPGQWGYRADLAPDIAARFAAADARLAGARREKLARLGVTP